jgi:predicted nucleotidyltransferase
MVLKVRDKDAPISREGIIFRVYGYDHPPNACVCDVEYAPETIYQATESKAVRTGLPIKYYKFYADGGLRFVQENYPQYQIFSEPLQRLLVGMKKEQISELRKPDQKLGEILEKEPKDNLIKALRQVLDLILNHSRLKPSDFGVFGSILHGFYNVKYSDLDYIIYGRDKVAELVEVLSDFYSNRDGALKNEFDFFDERVEQKNWRFENYSLKEYAWYEKRKGIYAVHDSEELGRRVKIEFEPVRAWKEIKNEYSPDTRIAGVGWTRAKAIIKDDKDSYFMPAIYPIEILEFLNGDKADDIERIITYVEEYKMQVRKDEEVIVEGILEKVQTPRKTFHQITLTHIPGKKYYKQVIKINK